MAVRSKRRKSLSGNGAATKPTCSALPAFCRCCAARSSGSGSLGSSTDPTIRRAGRAAAISGLFIGYLPTVVLMAGLIGWASTGSESAETARSSGNTISASPLPRELPPTIVTSVAPPPSRPRAKLNLAQVVTGTCAEIQKRDRGDDALDLFGVPCEHRQGVYSVVTRVAADSDCRSTYVAAPPDHSFALCLNEY